MYVQARGGQISEFQKKKKKKKTFKVEGQSVNFLIDRVIVHTVCSWW